MGVDGEPPDMGGLLASLRDCLWPPSAPPTAHLGQVSCLGGPGPALAIFRSVLPSLKWVEVWVKLAPRCQCLLVTACALKVRGPLSGSMNVWLDRCMGRSAEPGAAMCCVCVCVFVSWQKKVGLGREEGQTMEGVARGAGWRGRATGVSELRL